MLAQDAEKAEVYSFHPRVDVDSLEDEYKCKHALDLICQVRPEHEVAIAAQVEQEFREAQSKLDDFATGLLGFRGA